MKQSITLRSAGPFLLLTFIYFIVGFLTTVNGQCQGPLKIAFPLGGYHHQEFPGNAHLLRLLPGLSAQ